MSRPVPVSPIPFLLLALAACGGGAPAARVTITAPADGDTVGPGVTVRLEATGWRVVPADGLETAGEGHHHLFLDVDPVAAGDTIGRAQGIVHLGSGASEHTFEGLAPGPHRVIAVAAFGSHRAMPGVARDTVTFTVRADSTGASPVTP